VDFKQERIINKFLFNAETGEITRKRNNTVVTSKDQDGYIVVADMEHGRNDRMRGARLVWVMHNGDIPKGYIIDHKNRIRDDNRLENLRLATVRDNTANALRHGDDYTSIYKGVQLDTRGRWIASIQSNSVTTNLGYFATEEAAAFAYNVEASKRYGEFAVLNDVPEVNLEDFISERDRDFLNEERRGLPKHLSIFQGRYTLKCNNKVYGTFALEDKEIAIQCAKDFLVTGVAPNIRENLMFYNKFKLPYNVFPCSTGFRASFIKDKIRYHVGTFRTEEEAVKALHIKQDEVGFIRKEMVNG